MTLDGMLVAHIRSIDPDYHDVPKAVAAATERKTPLPPKMVIESTPVGDSAYFRGTWLSEEASE